jgi:hypothetical protein
LLLQKKEFQMITSFTPPTVDEYAPFYADYIQRAQALDIWAALSKQINDIQFALGHLADQPACFRPAPQEWSIKEVMGHLNDVERVFSYRLLRVSRNDPTPLPGFEQEDFVRAAGYDNYKLSDLIQEFEHLRLANILAIKNISEKALDNRGTASGFTVSARALIFMLVGHVEHHMASLREKYLPALG